MHFRRIIAGLAATTLAAAGLTACSNDSSDEAADGTTEVDNSSPIRIGTTDANLEEWDVFQDLAEEAGIAITLQNFSDYNTPNQALSEDQIDTNKFQHLKFLAEYNVGNDTDLVPLASTEIYPLALFWKDHDSLDGIEGEDVVIPNDPTNQGRALLVLKQAGLIEFKNDDVLTPTPADIDPAASKVTVTPVEAAQTTAGYSEGSPSIINNTFLGNAGLEPDDALFQDDPNSEEAEPYINVWAVRAEDANDERLLKLVELWKDPAVAAAVAKSSGGSAVPVERPQSDLQAILDRLEAQVS